MRLPLTLASAMLSVWALGFFGAQGANAQGQRSFSDVPTNHSAYLAVEYLKAQGIIRGYSDGTYQPDRKVNRAEATKIIVGPNVSEEDLAQFTETPFTDIPAGAWYLKYVEIGRRVLGFIDGPPKKTAFNGQDTVLQVEFLKMLLIANNIDPVSSYEEIKLPLSDDVTNPDEWYYPHLRYAITASMLMIGEDGMLHPGKQLSRGDVAILMHRFMMYRDNRRTQALLSEAEGDILLILETLEDNNITQAEYASARALLAARGALASRPDVPLVQSALKITEAFRALVRAYRAGLDQDFDAVIKLAGDAYNLADQAKSISSDMGSIADQIKESAGNMANSARELKGE